MNLGSEASNELRGARLCGSIGWRQQLGQPQRIQADLLGDFRGDSLIVSPHRAVDAQAGRVVVEQEAVRIRIRSKAGFELVRRAELEQVTHGVGPLCMGQAGETRGHWQRPVQWLWLRLGLAQNASAQEQYAPEKRR